MGLANITSRGRTTIPKSIRDAAGLREGDVVAFEIEDDRLVLRRVVPEQGDCPSSLAGVMGEWLSPEDERAWRDL